MLRSALLTNAKTVRLTAQRRAQSSSSGGGGGGVKIILGATVVATGGVLGYARLEPSFAKTLNDNIPVLKPVLDAVGADTSGKPSLPPPLKSSTDPESLLKKVKPIETPKEVPKPKPTATPAKAPPPTKTNDDDVEVKRQKQNFNLEHSLRDLSSSLEKVSSDAVASLNDVAKQTEEYSQKLWRALDEASVNGEDQFMWKEANAAKSVQQDAEKKAIMKVREAASAIGQLESLIEKGRADPATKDNINLYQAEQTLSKVKQSLMDSDEAAAKKFENLNLARKFESSIEESRKNLIEEVSAMLPGKSFSDPKSLTVDDLNVLVQHAHKKIEAFQKELSRVQLTDDEKSRQYRQQLSALDREVSRQKNEVAKLVAERLQEEQKRFETDLQNQLRNQLSVHTEHLKEALGDQKEELDRKKQLEVERAREDERLSQVSRLSEANERLQRMEAYLRIRQQLDEASKKAKTLWLSCASLKHALSLGRTEKVDSLQPLSADIVPLKKSFKSSEFVRTVLESVPDAAISRGIYPEIALKERFGKVETACRRVALLEDNNGGGPIRHMLSHLMSFMTIYPKPVTQDELENEIKVNPLMWDTLDVLSRVRASLHREDLEQALRYANQLKGKPRQVAQDWINELTLLLETKQAASVLMAYAASVVAEDLPK